MYTMRLTGSKVTFIVDSPPSDDNHDGKITDDEMPYSVGHVYEDPPKSLLLGFVKPSTDEKPVKDEMGWTMSGYCPVYNSKQEAVGLIGVDMSLSKLHKKMYLIKRAGLISLSVSIILSILLSLYFSNKFIQPLNLLRRAFKNLSNGEFRQMEVNRQDEIGELLRDFNNMISELKEKQLLRSFLGKIVDPTLVKEMITNDPKIGGSIVEAVIVFCDIKKLYCPLFKFTPNFCGEYIKSLFYPHGGYCKKNGTVMWINFWETEC